MTASEQQSRDSDAVEVSYELAKRVLPVPVAVALHQPLAAVFYAAIWTSRSGRLDWFVDYIHEYLIWGMVAPRTFESVDVQANIGSLIVLTLAAAVYFKNYGK